MAKEVGGWQENKMEEESIESDQGLRVIDVKVQAMKY